MKNSVISIVIKKMIETGTRHDEFREILSKFDLGVCGKVPFLIFLKIDTSKNIS